MGTLTQTVGTTTNGTTTAPIVPDWYSQAQNTIAGQGASIAGQDYQSYQGPRVAALTADQLNAQQLTRNLASGTQPDPSQMQGAVNYGLSQFDPNEVQKYMSPYTSGVVDEIGRLGNKNLFQNVLPGVNSTFTGAGQFGSTRNADFENRAIQDNSYNVLGQQSQALNTAMNGALSNYSAWHQQAIPNAQAANTLASQNNQALGTAGALEQAQNQNNLNTAYSDFQNQTDFGKNQLNWYANLTNGQQMPATSSSTTSQQAFLPSGLQTAASVYGLMNGVAPKGAAA
jgi:hypothetical protein